MVYNLLLRVTEMKKPHADAPNHLYSIGYEGRSVEDLFTLLSRRGIKMLIDTRYRPASRRPGMSKNQLAVACSERSIAYVHDADLGTPPEQMTKMRELGGYTTAAFEEYRTYLITKRPALQKAADAAKDNAPACLLCFEADANNCHRKVVAEEIASLTGLRIVHL